jgi:hypothetical protein
MLRWLRAEPHLKEDERIGNERANLQGDILEGSIEGDKGGPLMWDDARPARSPNKEFG